MTHRKCILSLTAVLLLSSSTFAFVGRPVGPSIIGQAQGFAINAFNIVERFGGVGSAEGKNMVMVGHDQEAYDIATGTAALQEETAILTQNAGAIGACGANGVVEGVIVNGSQGQLIGPGMRSEGQALGVGLNTVVHQAGSVGGAMGSQGFIGVQDQLEISPNGISAGSQFVGAAQFSAVSGGPLSCVVVDNGLDVSLNQNSTVVHGPSPPGPCPPPCDP